MALAHMLCLNNSLFQPLPLSKPRLTLGSTWRRTFSAPAIQTSCMAVQASLTKKDSSEESRERVQQGHAYSDIS
jgi:hypothetical protein